MKKVIFTLSFRKYIKKVKKHFNEQNILENIKEFIRLGFRKGESKLTTVVFNDITIDIVKLRIYVHDSVGRYLLGIIEESEYIPIFIDIKQDFMARI
jgi:hypothetical protein